MPKNKNKNINTNTNKHQIYSEAFPPNKNGERKKLSSFSSYHEILIGEEIDIKKIIYKPLTKSYKEEIKKLHKEWFPVEYDDDYFENIFINKYGGYFTIGAFYKIKEQEIILGLALCQYREISDYFINHTSPQSIEEICKNIDFNEEVQSYLRCEDYLCAYIMTIGVLDECRKLHIGSEIIKNIINKVLWDNICVGIYLDVINYNNSAIKFYERNGFHKVSTIKNYYELKGTYYDSEVFLKIFTRKEKDDFRAKNYSILRKIINLLVLTPINIVFKVIFFFLLCQCFRNKIKTE